MRRLYALETFENEPIFRDINIVLEIKDFFRMRDVINC